MEVAFMQQDIPKMCADFLRAFTIEKHNIKLLAAHAHELFAAYAGYPSKNAMLADKKFSISNLPKAQIVVMAPDADIDRRRRDLQGLSPDLPGSYALGEPIYTSLFANNAWESQYPPFRSFEKAARYLVERNYTFQEVFKFYRDIPFHHFVSTTRGQDEVELRVIHATETSAGDLLGNGETTIVLPRVAGHIGFGEPQIFVEQWIGGARRNLGPTKKALH